MESEINRGVPVVKCQLYRKETEIKVLNTDYVYVLCQALHFMGRTSNWTNVDLTSI